MINNQNSVRWYHHLMPSFMLQAVLTFVAFLVLLLQLAVYENIEQAITEYRGTCETTINQTITDDEPDAVLMVCDGESVNMSSGLTVDYLHKTVLNEDNTVVCEKKVTSMLGSVSWICDLKTQMEENNDD